MTRFPRYAAAAAAAAAALLYLGAPSAWFNFDGVACAIAVELGDCARLTHGNHLAYGVVGWGFYELWRMLGYQGHALLTLQAGDSLLGGAAVGVFVSLLRRLGLPVGTGLAAGAALAVSYAWWLWSLEAQVYMFGALFMLLAVRECLAEKPRPIRVGFWQALAVLGHVGHLMLAVAVLDRLYAASKPGFRRSAASYAAGLALPVTLAYAAAAALCVRPSSFHGWRVWLLGSAALNLDQSFGWIGGWSWTNLGVWLNMTFRIFSDPDGLSGGCAAMARALGIVAVAGAVFGAARAEKSLRRFVLLWLAGYAVLYSTWQPQTMVYRITDLAPLWLLTAAGLGSPWPALRQNPRWARTATAWLGIWAAAALAFNGKYLIGPKTDLAANQDYRDAVWLGSQTPEQAWIAVLGVEQVYVPYFAVRRPLNIRYYAGAELALTARLAALDSEGLPVFITSRTLESEGWEGFFRGHGIAPAAESPRGTILYRVTGKGSRKGASRKD